MKDAWMDIREPEIISNGRGDSRYLTLANNFLAVRAVRLNSPDAILATAYIKEPQDYRERLIALSIHKASSAARLQVSSSRRPHARSWNRGLQARRWCSSLPWVRN
jgi:hypothetical protein